MVLTATGQERFDLRKKSQSRRGQRHSVSTSDAGFDIAYAGADGLADLLVSAEVRNVSPDTVEPLLESLVDEIFDDGLLDANHTIDELINNILLP